MDFLLPAAVGTSADLGRYAQGRVIVFTLAPAGADSTPASQSATPQATVYDEFGDVIATVDLAPALGEDSVAFQGSLYLGRDFAWGSYRVVLRGDGIVATASFAVTAGGDSGGDLISLYSHDRPEARYVLGQLSGGSLVQGRDPHF